MRISTFKMLNVTTIAYYLWRILVLCILTWCHKRVYCIPVLEMCVLHSLDGSLYIAVLSTFCFYSCFGLMVG